MNIIDEKIKKGYVYFVYSNITKMIYVGQTTSTDRIEIYRSFIKKKDGPGKISSYNYYTKTNTINYNLAGDLVDSKNDFKVLHFETKYNKHLEKTYIRFLTENGYNLYNSILYKSHKYDSKEIDIDLIQNFKRVAI